MNNQGIKLKLHTPRSGTAVTFSRMTNGMPPSSAARQRSVRPSRPFLKNRLWLLVAVTLLNTMQASATFLFPSYASEVPKKMTTKERAEAWKARREGLLEETQMKRSESKNIYDTRRYVRKMRHARSNAGAQLLAGGIWMSERTANFLILFSAGDSERAGRLAMAAERARKRILGDLGELKLVWPKKAEVFLVGEADRKKYTRTDSFHTNSFSIPEKLEIYLNAGHSSSAESELAHHAAHLILRSYVDTQVRSGLAIPPWLDEGFAEYTSRLEFHRERFGEMRKKGKKLSLLDVLRVNAASGDRAAAQNFQTGSALLIDFILEKYGPESFREIVDLLLPSGIPYAYAGRSKPDAGRARGAFEFLIRGSDMNADFKSFEEFEKAWQEFLSGLSSGALPDETTALYG